MRTLKNKYYEAYDKICDRCTKCPYYYFEKGWEDNNEGCEIKGWDFDNGLCINMFLPKWILKLKYKARDYKVDRKLMKHEKKIKKECKKCKEDCSICSYGYCSNDDGWQCSAD